MILPRKLRLRLKLRQRNFFEKKFLWNLQKTKKRKLSFLIKFLGVQGDFFLKSPLGFSVLLSQKFLSQLQIERLSQSLKHGARHGLTAHGLHGANLDRDLRALLDGVAQTDNHLLQEHLL